jgi:hypothetical protein
MWTSLSNDGKHLLGKKPYTLKQGGRSMSKRGRPSKKYSPDHAKQVQALSQYGVPQDDIAATIGVCVETMQRLYGDELRQGRAWANAKVGRSLFDKCQAGDTTALIFWAKTQMGWKETQKLDHSSSDGTMSPPLALHIDFVDKGADGVPDDEA